MKANTEMDYRFAWRWLLPHHKDMAVFMAGLTEAELAFWSTALAPVKIAKRATEADGWIIAVDPDTGSSIATATPSAKLRWVCVEGPRSAVSRWKHQLKPQLPRMREYALIPRDLPRIVVPLCTPAHTYCALGLHRPGRPLVRAATHIARILSGKGISFPLRRRQLLIAERDAYRWPVGAQRAEWPTRSGGGEWDYALYLGTRNANRKTVILPIGSSPPEVLIKAGETATARAAVRHEAATLDFLGQTPLHSQVPATRGCIENSSGVYLYQEYRARCSANRKQMHAAVVEFLGNLSRLNQRNRPLLDVMNELRSPLAGTVVSEETKVLRKWLFSKANEGAMVYEHRTHGDFAPWNCAWTRSGFYVFDWEASRKTALAFGDAFHYILAPAIQAGYTSTFPHLIQEALAFAKRILRAAGPVEADLRLHLLLWSAMQPESGTLQRAVIATMLS